VLRRRLSELAIPEDYVGVPWTDGAPRIVAMLQDEKSAVTEGRVCCTDRAGGRSSPRWSRPVIRCWPRCDLHGTAVPALAQQVRDAQRNAARLTDDAIACRLR
jgi:hypothetical protein